MDADRDGQMDTHIEKRTEVEKGLEKPSGFSLEAFGLSPRYDSTRLKPVFTGRELLLALCFSLRAANSPPQLSRPCRIHSRSRTPRNITVSHLDPGLDAA